MDAFHLRYGNHRDDNLLEHGPAVIKPGAAHKIEPVGSSGQQKFHRDIRMRRDFGISKERMVGFVQIFPEDEPLMGFYGIFGIECDVAFVYRLRGLFLVNEPMIRRDDDVGSVQ